MPNVIIRLDRVIQQTVSLREAEGDVAIPTFV
jgi:hypothetical protein